VSKGILSDWFSRDDEPQQQVALRKKPNPRNIANAAKAEELERELERYVVAVYVNLRISTDVFQIKKGATRMGRPCQICHSRSDTRKATGYSRNRTRSTRTLATKLRPPQQPRSGNLRSAQRTHSIIIRSEHSTTTSPEYILWSRILHRSIRARRTCNGHY
jgi:hypothetical protein